MVLARVVMVIALFWPMLSFSADEQIVQQMSGNGSRNLRPFTVKDRWEIRWDNKGTFLNITVREPDGKPAHGGAQSGPGEGSTYQPKGGSYYLDISAMGDWKVTVVQLP